MKISEHTPLFQAAGALPETQAPQVANTSESLPAEISPEESLVLHALNPATWLSAKLVVPETNDGASQAFEFELPNREQLLNSLQRAEINIEAAQSFVGEVGNLLSDLRSLYGLPEHSQAYLLIETAQETLMLDPQRLDPHSLFNAFSAAKAQLNPQELQANHLALADLAAEAVAGMRSDPPEMPKTSAEEPLFFARALTDSSPERFLTQLQSFQVPSAEALVQAWLSQVQASPSGGDPENPTGPSGSSLGSDTEALIQRANALEEGLNLAPKPNSPDIVELFRAFLKIFVELDLALNAIAANLDYNRKEKAGILAEFGQQLQENMRLSREKLDKLRQEAHEQLLEGLDLLKKQMGTKAALLCQPNQDPAPEAQLLLQIQRLKEWCLEGNKQ
ncbi:MAG: hypothetical protein AB7I41_17955 [Candidatus Sericytochromatia bacterium]